MTLTRFLLFTFQMYKHIPPYKNDCRTVNSLLAQAIMNNLQQTKPVASSSLQGGFQLGFKRIKIRCQFCGEYLCQATETQCGHAFCSECIAFYLLFLDACPRCEAPLRKTTLFRNIPLDNIIEDYIQLKVPAGLPAFRQRRQALKEVKKRRRLGRVRVGMRLDVRDEDYVWCVGRVRKVVQGRHGSSPCILVQFLFSRNHVFLNSDDQRVALLGSYTNRIEVPHYSNGRVTFYQPNGVETELETTPSEQEQKVM